MQILWIKQDDPSYPDRIKRCLSNAAPDKLRMIGNADILQRPCLALICSVQCPGSIILKTFDAMQYCCDRQITVLGGFHSPMERDCLDILLRGAQPVILCPAKRLQYVPMGKPARKALREGRLLALSCFGDKVRRTTAKQAVFRNDLVAALADTILVPYAAENGKTWHTVRRALEWGKRVITFGDRANRDLIDAGASIGFEGQWQI